jgi:CBS domain-containing protein
VADVMAHLVNDAQLQPVPVVEADDSVSLAAEILDKARCSMVAVRLPNGYGILPSDALELADHQPLMAVGSLRLEPAMILSRGDTTAMALSRLNLCAVAMGVVRLSEGLVGVVTTDELKLLL